ncbi:Lrp/AsnC family transcriptional regulator [Neokomagataea thailandica]|uniref:Leucine responsive regulatory protein n=1 Tax=Neokomagataea tanensis NBRC 106556 TaxID=1223519 RepID=A0ABQ0QIG8_9PROT|nr:MULTISPECIES: Lrp/AsnC family transcriptional regulator [Neokomagataea]GBR45964.1 leucine responsive regulatory protein [Neokomagataea tanensis NBRC 106556]
MDKIDLHILHLLQTDNRRSAAELGQEVGLSVSAASDRIRRLNASGLIHANRAVVNSTEIGLALCVFMFVDLEPRADEQAFIKALMQLPEVQEAHHVSGPHSWLLKVRVHNAAALQYLLSNHLKSLPCVLRTESIIVLDTAKETTELALTVTSVVDGGET